MSDAKAISFTPDVLKAKLRALEEYGRCMTRRPLHPTPPQMEAVVAKSGATFSIFADKHQPERFRIAGPVWAVRDLMGIEPVWRPPFGMVGQRLWIRERARVLDLFGGGMDDDAVRGVSLEYAVDGVRRDVQWSERLKSPVVGRCIPNGVRREGARHFLEVVEVRVERVVEISADDVCLEGVDCVRTHFVLDAPLQYRWAVAVGGEHESPQKAYFALYDSIYGDGAHARDWCWVYTLKRAEQ